MEPMGIGYRSLLARPLRDSLGIPPSSLQRAGMPPVGSQPGTQPGILPKLED